MRKALLVSLVSLWLLAPLAWAQWVVVHDGNGVSASDVPQPLCDALQAVVQRGERIKSVFLHKDGSWGILYGTNGWQTALTNRFSELNNDLKYLHDGGFEPRQVTLQPEGDGYAIVYGEKGVTARRIPQTLVDYVQRGIPGNHLSCLALGPADHWFLSFDQGGYQSVAALTVLDAIKPMATAYRRMDWVWYSNNQFGMIYESNGWTGLSVPGDLQRELDRLNAQGSTIQLVAALDQSTGSAALRLAPNLAQANAPTLQPLSALPPLANPQRRLVSAAYGVTSPAPFEVTIPFERGSLPPGASVYPVLGRGPAVVRLPGGRVDLEKGLLTLRVDRLDAVHLDAGADYRSSFFAAAVDTAGLQAIFQKPDCTIWAEPQTLAKASAAVPAFYQTFSEVRANYTRLGFRLPPQIDVYLLPLRSVRGVAGPSTLEFNLDVWDGSDSSRATIAHEMFHIVQSNQGQGADLNQNTQVEGNWCDEATALLMGYRLYPKADTLVQWAQSLDPEYLYRDLMTFVPNSEGENAGHPAHQYQSFIFFRYLESLYDLDSLLHALYPAQTPSGRPDSVHTLLESFVAGTPDRKGRRRAMTEIYLDFCLTFAWTKNLHPLELASKLRKKNSLQLPAAGGPYHQGWNLPFEEGGQRLLSKTFRGYVGRYAIAKAYNLSSMTKKEEKGDLNVRLEGPPKARLVVFPYRSNAVDPILGSSDGQVTVKDWHKWGGAVIWVVYPAEGLREPYSLTVTMKGDQPPPAVAGGRWVCAGPRLLQGPPGFDPQQTRYTYTDAAGRTITMSWSPPPLVLQANQEFALAQHPDQNGNLIGQCYWAWNYAFEAVSPPQYHWQSTNRGQPGQTPPEIRLRLKNDEAAVKYHPQALERVVYVNVFIGATPLQIEWRYEYQK